MFKNLLNLFRKKEDPFQVKAFTQIRSEQIQASSIKLRHIHDEVGIGKPFFGKAHQNGVSQDIPASVWTKISWQEVTVNDVGQGSMLELPVEEKGRYIVNVNVEWSNPITDSQYQIYLYKNGAPFQIIDSVTTPAKFISSQPLNTKGSTMAPLLPGDTLAVYAYCTYGGTITADAQAQIVKGR